LGDQKGNGGGGTKILQSRGKIIGSWVANQTQGRRGKWEKGTFPHATYKGKNGKLRNGKKGFHKKMN